MGNYDRRKTPCATCMSAFKWIPVIFIAAVIAWSYYAYVVQLCIFAITNTFEKIVYLIFYHIVLALFLWAYWSTVFTPVGTVPSHWRIPESDIERLFRAENQDVQKRILENCAKDLPITNRTLNGSVRFCEKCKIIKPDRAHHCSVCGGCVLKMDHHCPWVNNCVNFANYKFFVLFLGYALLYCLYVALTSLEYFISFWKGELDAGGMGRFHILFLFFVAIMFAISLVSLFGYHIYLVFMNRTTLEAFRAPIFRIGGPDKNGFNLGKQNNFQEVFGDNWKLWFLPIYTSLGDGSQYPTQKQHQCNSYDSMGATRNSSTMLSSSSSPPLLSATYDIHQQQEAQHDSLQPQPQRQQMKQEYTEIDLDANTITTTNSKTIVLPLAANKVNPNVNGNANASANANGNVVIDINALNDIKVAPNVGTATAPTTVAVKDNADNINRFTDNNTNIDMHYHNDANSKI